MVALKVCLITDTHLSAQKYSKLDKKTGVNRFMIRQFETLEWIADYLKKHKINTIIHSGDVFDSVRVTAYPIKRTREILNGFDVYAIKGNHDDSNLFHTEEMSAVDLLGVHSFNKPESVVIGGANFCFTPWGFDIDTTLLDKTKKNILVAHGFPRDYMNGNETKEVEHDGDVLSISRTTAFDMVITGHYHNIDEFEIKGTKFLNPGAISGFANADGNDPSIWILDTETLEYERVVIPCAIKLITVKPNDVNSYLSKINKENIYRITIYSKTDVDNKILSEAKKKALDIQLKIIKAKEEKANIEKVDGFWAYVEKHSGYKSEFQKVLVELGA